MVGLEACETNEAGRPRVEARACDWGHNQDRPREVTFWCRVHLTGLPRSCSMSTTSNEGARLCNGRSGGSQCLGHQSLGGDDGWARRASQRQCVCVRTAWGESAATMHRVGRAWWRCAWRCGGACGGVGWGGQCHTRPTSPAVGAAPAQPPTSGRTRPAHITTCVACRGAAPGQTAKLGARHCGAHHTPH